MTSCAISLVAVFVLVSSLQCQAFFLSYVAFVSSVKFNQLTGYSFPALYPQVYYDDWEIPVFEKKESPFGTNYNFCPAAYNNEKNLQNALDELLWSLIRVPYESYQVIIPKNESCKLLCSRTFIGGYLRDENELCSAIGSTPYRHWVIDGIPVLFCMKTNEATEQCFTRFPTSCFSFYNPNHICFKYKPYCSGIIFNHIDLDIFYEESDGYSSFNPARKIVSAKVTPKSFKHTDPTDCSDKKLLIMPKVEVPGGESFNVHYTYSVRFIESHSIKYESRWKHLLNSLVFSDLHWIELIYATLIILFSLIFFFLVSKAGYCDICSCIPDTKVECGEDIEEKYRWRLVKEIYIPPYCIMMISVLLGTILQLTFMSVSLLGFSLLAFQVTESRDEQMIWAMIVFMCQGVIGGYTSSLAYKNFVGDKWIANVFVTAIFCSGVTISVFGLLDIILMYVDGTATLTLYTLGGFLCAWFPCFVFFNIIGSLFGFREEIKKLKSTLMHSSKMYWMKGNEIFYRTFFSGEYEARFPHAIE